MRSKGAGEKEGERKSMISRFGGGSGGEEAGVRVGPRFRAAFVAAIAMGLMSIPTSEEQGD